MKRIYTLAVVLSLFHFSLQLKADKPTLVIKNTYCYSSAEQEIKLEGVADAGSTLSLEIWNPAGEGSWDPQEATFSLIGTNYEGTVNLKLGAKIQVKDQDDETSIPVTFDESYLKKPSFTKISGDLNHACWNEKLKFSASYDCTPDNYQLIFTDFTEDPLGVESIIEEYDDLPATIIITPPGKGKLKIVAIHGAHQVSSVEYTIIDVITTTEYEIGAGGTYPYDQGDIPLTGFFEDDAPPLDDSKTDELTLNLEGTPKSYTVYTENENAPFTFYKFIFPTSYVDAQPANNKVFNTQAEGVTYNQSAANRVKFYYGVKTTDKVCFEEQYTDIVVLRNKIFIPQSSYCSDDAIESTITIDKVNDSYYADILTPGYSQVVSYKEFILKVDDEEIEPHDTTYSVINLPHSTTEKITFSPDNLYVSGRDQVFVEITAYLTIDLFYEEPGTGYLPGWSSNTPYALNAQVQYNGFIYTAKQSIPIKIYDKLPFEPEEIDVKQEYEVDVEPLFTLYYPSPSSSLYWAKGDAYEPGGGAPVLKTSSTLPFASESFYIFKANEDGRLDIENNTYCKSNSIINLIESNGYTITGITKHGLPDPLPYITNNDNKWTFKTEEVLDPEVVSEEVSWDLYYVDNRGCTAPAKKIKFTIDENYGNPGGANFGLNASYCPENTEIKLNKSPDIYSLIGNIEVNNNGDITEIVDNYFNPSEYWNSGEDTKTLEFNFSYRHYTGCAYKDNFEVTINPKPTIEYFVDDVCFGDPVNFTGSTSYSNTLENLTWEWDFDDYATLTHDGIYTNTDPVLAGTHNGNTAGTYVKPTHVYSEAGKYNASLKVTSENGCSAETDFDITVGSYPVISITPTGFIENSVTTFTNSSEDEIFDIVNYAKWDFDDPTAVADSIIQNSILPADYTFETTGVHNVILTLRTETECESSDTVKVPIFPKEIVTTDNTYMAIFDDLNQGWLSSDEFDKGLPSGWKLKTVAAPFSKDSNDEGMIWVTGDSTLLNENSWVESPCFDISNLEFPLLSMDIYQSVEEGRDGTALQYTLDDGENWNLLGDVDEGVNWYNTIGIVSSPGSQSGASVGWSLDAKEWKTARYSLDDLKADIATSTTGCARFRVAYSSDAGNAPGIETQGFAFDNFTLTSRNRVVMIEQFVNSVQDKTLQENEEGWLDAFLVGKNAEVVDMRYHNIISYNEDPLFKINPPDISSRSMEYGATRSQLTMVDGVYRCLANSEVEAKSYYKERTLTDIAFDIDNVTHIVNGDDLSITADITKLKDDLLSIGSDKCVVRMAIVQHAYEYNGETYKNVVVELLPNGEGNVVATIPADFPANETMTVKGTWTPNVTTKNNEFRLVVYVQGIWGVDEVHQVWFQDSISVPQVTVTPSAESLKSGKSNDFTIYPSPVKEKLNLNWKQTLENPVRWKLVSMSGTVVKEGTTAAGEIHEEIETYQLNKGIYLLLTEDQVSSEVEQRKILIVK